MAVKFSQFVVETDKANVNYLVGWDGVENVQISPANLLGGYPSGTGAAGQVTFFSAASTVTGDNDFYWDNTNKRLGIGTTSPEAKLDVESEILISGTDPILRMERGDGFNSDIIKVESSTDNIIIGDTSLDEMILEVDSGEAVRIDGSGNVGISTTSPSAKLDVQGTLIATGISQLGSSGSNVLLTSSSGGNVGIGTASPSEKLSLLDNAKIGLGDSADLQIYHDGSNSIIENSTGNLRFTNTADNKDIVFQTDNGSGTATTYFRLDGSSANSGILYTQFPDNSNITFGSADDLQIKHDGTDSKITNTNGDLYIRNFADDKDIIFQSDDGSGGVATYFFLDGSNAFTQVLKDFYFLDNVKARFGDSGDFTIHHNTNTFLKNVTNNLIIENTVDDANIQFKCDDGSGGTIEYFRVDGGTVETTFSKDLRIIDNEKLILGTSNDLELFHNGTNTVFNAYNGNLEITNFADDKDIVFKSDNGSGGTTEYFRVDGGDVRTIASKPFRFIDTIAAEFGTGLDMQIFHSGGEGTISNTTGNLRLLQQQDNGDIQFFSDDGSGGMTEYFRVDGGTEEIVVSKKMQFNDNVKAVFGTGEDLDIFHDGTDSTIDNALGDLIISNNADDKDIIFKSDNGSGGLATYLRLDGSDTLMQAGVNLRFSDNIKGTFGNSDDLQIYHDGSDSYIKDSGTGDLKIQGDNNVYIGSTGGEFYFRGIKDDAAVLYFNNSSKFATTSSGVQVTGRMAINDGNSNVLVGDAAGDALTTGNENVAIGELALTNETEGSRSVAIGAESLKVQNNTGQANNTAVGFHAGRSVTTGTQNTLIGSTAGDAITTGIRNVAVGFRALTSETGADQITAIGNDALKNYNKGSGDANVVAIGYHAAQAMTTGNGTIIGATAGNALTTGTNNIVVGANALGNEDTGSKNIAIGTNALENLNNDGDSYNVAVGHNAGRQVSTGDQNTIIGGLAGDSLTTGTNNVIIGYNAEASAIGAADEITLGNANNDTIRAAVQTISSLSDERDKTNIQESTYGLDFIDQLNPVTFDWNTRDGSRKGKKDLGFIAQELDAVDDEYTQLVYKSNPDKLEASYGRLVPVLVKAIQELKQEIEHLKNK